MDYYRWQQTEHTNWLVSRCSHYTNDCVYLLNYRQFVLAFLVDSFLVEKTKEIWWKKLLEHEDDIDVKKIDCSRPFDELSEDMQAELNQIQYDEQQRLKGEQSNNEHMHAFR